MPSNRATSTLPITCEVVYRGGGEDATVKTVKLAGKTLEQAQTVAEQFRALLMTEPKITIASAISPLSLASENCRAGSILPCCRGGR